MMVGTSTRIKTVPCLKFTKIIWTKNMLILECYWTKIIFLVALDYILSGPSPYMMGLGPCFCCLGVQIPN